MIVIDAVPFKGPRLRARRVDEDYFAESVSQRAQKQNEWVVDVEHGGGVANAYKYPAETECVLAVSDPFGIVVYWTARTRANMVTYRGAALACLAVAADLFDERVKSVERKQEVLDLLKDAHQRVVPAMVVIAVASS